MRAVCEIMSGHRTVSGEFRHLTGYNENITEKMSGASDKCTQANNKRKINRSTVEKWITENDKTLDTTLWLKFEVASGDREHVSNLKCTV